MPEPQQRHMLTRKEAAARLSVSVRTLERLIRTGRITAYRVGLSAIRIDAADIENTILAGRLPATETPREDRS